LQQQRLLGGGGTLVENTADGTPQGLVERRVAVDDGAEAEGAVHHLAEPCAARADGVESLPRRSAY